MEAFSPKAKSVTHKNSIIDGKVICPGAKFSIWETQVYSHWQRQTNGWEQELVLYDDDDHDEDYYYSLNYVWLIRDK